MYKKSVSRKISWLMLFVLVMEMILSIDVFAAADNTGKLGDNGGYKWTYDENTMTLRISGEDTRLDKDEF